MIFNIHQLATTFSNMRVIRLTFVAIFMVLAPGDGVKGLCEICEEGYTRFVGLSQTKALFAITVSGDWQYVINYCHQYKMMAASIDNQLEQDIVANYLNASSYFDSFWLPATDYITEGTFAWIRTKSPFTFSNWANGHPTISRSRNCVAIQKDGTWVEVSCTLPQIWGLCEVPLLENYRTQAVNAAVIDQPQQITRERVGMGRSQQFSLEQQAKEAKIVPIGEVGSKLYFKDEAPISRKLHEALDFCHVLGMRVVSPEIPQELEFLSNYSRQLEQEGENPLIMTSGTDTLSFGCNRGNAVYRWFYSPEEIGLDAQLPSNSWYECLGITPAGFIAPDCIGWGAPTICELNTAY